MWSRENLPLIFPLLFLCFALRAAGEYELKPATRLEMKKQPQEYDTTNLTDPDAIESLSSKTTDTVIRGVLFALYQRAP